MQAAIEKANRIIENESVMVLSRKQSLRLLELIENPPPRNQKFIEAREWYERKRGDAHSSAKWPTQQKWI